MKKIILIKLILVVLAIILLVNWGWKKKSKEKKLLRGNLRVVIGSKSTGGDTYQNSVIVANKLAEQLGMNVKVDAVGASAAFDALLKSSDGHTIMIFHDQSYLGYLYGREGYYNIFETFTVGPTLSINPGNAFLVPKESPYNTVQDVLDAVGAGGKTIKVAIQPGGVSEIGYSAMKNAILLQYPGKEKNFVAVNTGSQSDKNILLFNRQADVINGSVQANEQFTRLPKSDVKAMKFIWLTANNKTIMQANENGFGETTRSMLLEYTEPKMKIYNNFTFDKEFFILYNKKMSAELVKYFDKALTAIFNAGEIQKIQKKAFFIPNYRPSAKAQKYLKAKMNTYAEIIASLK